MYKAANCAQKTSCCSSLQRAIQHCIALYKGINCEYNIVCCSSSVAYLLVLLLIPLAFCSSDLAPDFAALTTTEPARPSDGNAPLSQPSVHSIVYSVYVQVYLNINIRV
jgi:hypothetical protein